MAFNVFYAAVCSGALMCIGLSVFKPIGWPYHRHVAYGSTVLCIVMALSALLR